MAKVTKLLHSCPRHNVKIIDGQCPKCQQQARDWMAEPFPLDIKTKPTNRAPTT